MDRKLIVVEKDGVLTVKNATIDEVARVKALEQAKKEAEKKNIENLKAEILALKEAIEDLKVQISYLKGE